VDSELWLGVEAIEEEKITLSVHGHTASLAKGPWLFEDGNYWEPGLRQQTAHSISTQVLGTAILDRKAAYFRSFDLLALGQRKGRTINHGRSGDGVSEIGFVRELASPK
jgi:hypothetical protein